ACGGGCWAGAQAASPARSAAVQSSTRDAPAVWQRSTASSRLANDADPNDLIHLLARPQPTVGPAVSGLAAPLPASWPRPALGRGLRGIRRGRPRGVRRVLAQPRFQFADARLKASILGAQGGVLQPERRQLL